MKRSLLVFLLLLVAGICFGQTIIIDGVNQQDVSLVNATNQLASDVTTAYQAADSVISNYYAEAITNVTGAGINAAVKSGRIVTVTGTEADTLATVLGRGTDANNKAISNVGGSIMFHDTGVGLDVIYLFEAYNTDSLLMGLDSDSTILFGGSGGSYFPGQIIITGTGSVKVYQGANLCATFTNANLIVPGTISEGGTALASKYLGINATVTMPWCASPNILPTNVAPWETYALGPFPYAVGVTSLYVQTWYDACTVDVCTAALHTPYTNFAAWTTNATVTGTVTGDLTTATFDIGAGYLCTFRTRGEIGSTGVVITACGTNRVTLQ